MAQDRNSLKSPAEIYAGVLASKLGSYWSTLAGQVATAEQAQAQSSANNSAQESQIVNELPAILPWAAGGFIVLLLIARR